MFSKAMIRQVYRNILAVQLIKAAPPLTTRCSIDHKPIGILCRDFNDTIILKLYGSHLHVIISWFWHVQLFLFSYKTNFEKHIIIYLSFHKGRLYVSSWTYNSSNPMLLWSYYTFEVKCMRFCKEINPYCSYIEINLAVEHQHLRLGFYSSGLYCF